MKLFTIIDTRTGQEAVIADVVQERWAERLSHYLRWDGWQIDADGSVGLAARDGVTTWAPMDRFEIRWNREAKA